MDSRSRLNSSRIAAQRLRTSERTLERMRATGTGPKFVKVGRLVSYTDHHLEEYIAARVVSSTSEAQRRLIMSNAENTSPRPSSPVARPLPSSPGYLPIHPLADEHAMADPHEGAAMAGSIDKQGILVPITIWREEGKWRLDGWTNRVPRESRSITDLTNRLQSLCRRPRCRRRLCRGV